MDRNEIDFIHKSYKKIHVYTLLLSYGAVVLKLHLCVDLSELWTN